MGEEIPFKLHYQSINITKDICGKQIEVYY